MSMLLAFVLAAAAQGRVLPEVDRRALELQARAEALQPRNAARRSAAAPARQPASRTANAATPTTQRPAVTRQASASGERPATLRRASTDRTLDLASITTICRAAGNQADPANFLATLSRAYSMNPVESSSLRTSCAAYLAGRADARAVEAAPAH